MKLNLPPYRPRHIVFDDIWSIDGLSLKAYLITEESDRTVPQKLRTSAKSYIAKALPDARADEGHDHGLGYVVIHMGDMATWLLTRWWAHDNVGMSMLASADPGSTEFLSTDHRHFCACVWEHVVINHERDAWVQEAMKVGGTSEAYLGNRLQDGYY
ncbi:MAG: hypothetical protein RLO08_01035 [Parvibaculaceae bacterium]